MNIAIDIRSLLDKNYSGVGEYTYNLLKSVLARDRKNKYFLFYNSAQKKLPKKLLKFNYPNVFYCGFRYPNKLLNLSFFLFSFPKIDTIIKKKFPEVLKNKKIDLFFLPNLNFFALSSHCRRIMTVHDLSFQLFPEFYSLKRRVWHKAINFSQIVKKFDLLLTVSENTKKDLVKLYNLSPSRIKVIYPGISSKYRSLEKNKTNDLKRKYNLADKFILYVGNLEPRKNIESLLEALIEINDDVQLVVLGKIAWKTKEIFKTNKQANLQKRVIFTGYVVEAEKIKFYNLAKVVVYPSYYEGFGFPPLESLACQIPVITSYSSSLPEVVGNQVIMIDPFNVNEIKEALKIVLISNNLDTKKLKKFNWQITGKQFIDNYKNFA